MPDGSRDMYLGVGAIASPRYLGAAERQVRAMPLVQVELSNGVFVSGLSDPAWLESIGTRLVDGGSYFVGTGGNGYFYCFAAN